MATRGLYTFVDKDGKEFNVYKHWDNYPDTTGAYGFIQKALTLSYQLPNFDSGDFTASFISANTIGNDTRLVHSSSTNGNVLGIEYHYIVTAIGTALKVVTKDLYNEQDLDIVYITKKTIVETDSLCEIREAYYQAQL